LSWSLLCGTHPGRFQAEAPLIPLFRFPETALSYTTAGTIHILLMVSG
jgi:hypothetical protein